MSNLDNENEQNFRRIQISRQRVTSFHDYRNGECEILEGNWKAGWALDLHTTSSVMLPNGHFHNEYTQLGRALNQLKYHNDYRQLPFLIEQMSLFLRTRVVLPQIHVIFPVPASKQRPVQPVYELARGVSRELRKNIDFIFIKKVKSTEELKSMNNPEERKAALSGAFKVAKCPLYKGKNILLIDDLFRSGTTLNELTSVLYREAGVQNVYVVALTKTRKNR